MSLLIEPLPLLTDNYAYILRDDATGEVGIVDPSESDPVIAALDARGWQLTTVFNTHHHPDHTGGNAGLRERYGCPVVGPQYDEKRLKTLTRGVRDGDTVALGGHTAQVLYVPGHTLGHVVLWFKDAGAAFCGDTLFSLGCGRMFEGTADQMWASLSRIAALPPETKLYCGHEYTAANARFALSVDPDNAALKARAAEVDRLRGQGLPTLPTTVAAERACNPFLRAADPAIRQRLGMPREPDAQVFGELRKRKDNF